MLEMTTWTEANAAVTVPLKLSRSRHLVDGEVEESFGHAKRQTGGWELRGSPLSPTNCIFHTEKRCMGTKNHSRQFKLSTGVIGRRLQPGGKSTLYAAPACDCHGLIDTESLGDKNQCHQWRVRFGVRLGQEVVWAEPGHTLCQREDEKALAGRSRRAEHWRPLQEAKWTLL